jgi:hypothetical protein
MLASPRQAVRQKCGCKWSIWEVTPGKSIEAGDWGYGGKEGKEVTAGSVNK